MDEALNLNDTEDRRQIILAAAFKTISIYGFKRTSMDDIAKEVGISRPALYQYFANKQAIFQGIVEQAMVDTNKAIDDLLSKPMPLNERLAAMFEITVLSHHRMLEEMPHGEEILGLKSEVAQEQFDEWDRVKRHQFERALRFDPTIPEKLAAPLSITISHALSGMKSKGLNVDQMEKAFAAVTAVVAGVVEVQ